MSSYKLEEKIEFVAEMLDKIEKTNPAMAEQIRSSFFKLIAIGTVSILGFSVITWEYVKHFKVYPILRQFVSFKLTLNLIFAALIDYHKNYDGLLILQKVS